MASSYVGALIHAAGEILEAAGVLTGLTALVPLARTSAENSFNS